MSALFAATIRGFETLLSSLTNLAKSTAPHSVALLASNPASSTAVAMCRRFIPSPVSFGSRWTPMSSLMDWAVLAILSQSFLTRLRSQRSNSSSNIRTSSTGSWLPGETGWPLSSVAPAASATTIRASALLTSSRNWFPSPFPLWAPLMRPGQSMTSTGTRRTPSMQAELTGSSWTPSSLQTQGVLR